MNRKSIRLVVSLLILSLWSVNSWSLDLAQQGQYMDYSVKAFDEAKDSKRVLYFYASWCPSCIAGDRALKKADLLEGVVVFKTDYDVATNLKQKYGVVRQHTFVQVDEEGEKVSSWSGGVSSLAEKIK